MTDTDIQGIVAPLGLATALRHALDNTASYSHLEIAQALTAPHVYPYLSALDLARVLTHRDVYPALSRSEVRATLLASNVSAAAASEAVTALFGEPPLLTLVAAAASSELNALYNGRPQTATRLIEGPNDGSCFWNSDPSSSRPQWFSVQLDKPAKVSSLLIRWKSVDGPVGARAMKYKISSSMDGQRWLETGVTEQNAPGLSATQAVDLLPGWDQDTHFIKVELAESSYPRGYFTCRYVLVRGESTS